MVSLTACISFKYNKDTVGEVISSVRSPRPGIRSDVAMGESKRGNPGWGCASLHTPSGRCVLDIISGVHALQRILFSFKSNISYTKATV